MKTVIRKLLQEDLLHIIAFVSKKNKINLSLYNFNDKLFSKLSELIDYFGNNLDCCDLIISNKTIVGFSIYKKNQIDLMLDNDIILKKQSGSIFIDYVEKRIFQRHSGIFSKSFNPLKPKDPTNVKNRWHKTKSTFDETWSMNRIIFSNFKKSTISLILDSLDY